MTDSVIDELQTLADFVRWGASQFNEAGVFFGHGTNNAVDEAIVLVLHALHLPSIPETLWHARLTRQEKRKISQLFQRRICERIPAAYLTHEAWFANLAFYVDSRVLIPRSPLAELIEQQFSPWVDADAITHALDLCTGSGCIAIATAMLLPGVTVDATDISQEALAVAARNVSRYHLETQVQLIQSDMFANLVGKRYDLIVSNPPYVDAPEFAALPPEYRHEPRLGLTAGDDGLIFVKHILQHAANYLTENGILFVEVGASAETLIAAYPQLPLTWLDFKRGGDGVFMLTASQLRTYWETR
jgi:ribosomal protein L3 glutamine methyltransferase